VIIPALAALALQLAPAPTPAALEGGLAGQWSGTLTYRDYRNDKRYSLPVSTAFAAAADGATVTDVSTFDDGPKTGAVVITTVSLFDAKAGTVTSGSFRKGKTPELTQRRVSVARYEDPAHWTLTFEAEGQDNDRPARIRVVETRAGNELVSREEVAPVTPADAPYVYRNETRLRRGPAGA
jgi:hypothetical protein